MRTIKKFVGILLVVLISMTFTLTVFAQSYPTVGVITTNSGGHVIVRSAPDENSSKVRLLGSGTTVSVDGITGNWYKVSSSSFSGYVKTEFIVMTGEKVEEVKDNTVVVEKDNQFPKGGKITTKGATLTLRSEPHYIQLSKSPNNYICGMKNGASLTILDGKYKIENHSNGKTYVWYHVQYGQKVGYACLSESGTGYDYIQIEWSTTVSETQDKTTPAWIKTNGSNLYVRSSPQYIDNKIGLFANGTEITVTGNAVSGFYKVTGKLTNGTTVTGYACADYITVNKPNNVSGGQTVNAGGGKTLNVISYKQYNYPYDYVGNSTKSIKSVGCFVTSMAMVHSYNTGTIYTPVTIQKKLSFTGACFYHSSVTNLGYTMKKNTSKSSGYNIEMLKAVYNSIQNGRPAIVCISTAGGSTHYVTVTGYDGNPSNLTAYNFIINDPGSSRNTRLSQPLAGKPIITQAIY